MKVTIKNLQKKIPVNPKRIKRAILNVLSQEGAKRAGEITVCFLSDKQIRELNRKYLGKNTPTDVIAFDTGDIAVSAETALRNARLYNTTPEEELCLYAVHGALHLLGYDDKTAQQRKVMREREKKYAHT